jgi:hypothetical protein
VLSSAPHVSSGAPLAWYAAVSWNRDEHWKVSWTLSEESTNLDLEQLTKHVAEQIIFTIGSATGDPKAAMMRLLRRYLADTEDQVFSDALHSQQLEERDQQN